MAEQEELFSEDDVAGDGDAKGKDEDVEVEETDDTGDHVGMDDDAALTAEASKEAKEVGLEVPETDDCKEWVRHFITAVKTHKSTKNLNEEAGKADDEAAADDEEPAMPEPQMVAMSLRLQKLEAEKATRDCAELVADVDYIRKVTPWQLSEKGAKELTDKLTAKKLSLVDDANTELNSERIQIRTMKRSATQYMKKGKLLGSPTQLSASAPVEAPDGSWDDEADQPGDANKLLDEVLEMNGLK